MELELKFENCILEFLRYFTNNLDYLKTRLDVLKKYCLSKFEEKFEQVNKQYPKAVHKLAICEITGPLG